MFTNVTMIQSIQTGQVVLQPGSDLPALNEVPAHDHDALAQFSAVCRCIHVLWINSNTTLAISTLFHNSTCKGHN